MRGVVKIMIGERWRQVLALSALVIVLILIAVITFATVDVSAEAEPSRMEKRVSATLLHAKIHLARPAKIPPVTASEADIERGAQMYQQMCSFCHGATRGVMAPFARSLSPRPPQFVIQPARGLTWMDAYIIRHGIRWTGMPGFQDLPEADAWRLALYVEGRSQPRGANDD